MRDLREVSDSFTIWTYLSHEDRYKRTLAGVRAPLSLEAAEPPNLSATDILKTLRDASFADAEYGNAVVLTCESLSGRRWTERELTSTELGGVETILPNEGLPANGASFRAKSALHRRSWRAGRHSSSCHKSRPRPRDTQPSSESSERTSRSGT